MLCARALMRADAVAGRRRRHQRRHGGAGRRGGTVVVPGLAASAFFLDLNSVSPGVKREAAEAIEARGGRYVEAAVMAPISPKRIASPMLLGGPHAAHSCRLAASSGFAGAEVFSD